MASTAEGDGDGDGSAAGDATTDADGDAVIGEDGVAAGPQPTMSAPTTIAAADTRKDRMR
jgi:hypothetical protein